MDIGASLQNTQTCIYHSHFLQSTAKLLTASQTSKEIGLFTENSARASSSSKSFMKSMYLRVPCALSSYCRCQHQLSERDGCEVNGGQVQQPGAYLRE